VCYYHPSEQQECPLYLDQITFHNPYPYRLTITDKSSIPLENTVTMNLKPRDIGIFKGRHHLHWRNKITTDIDYRAILLHFNDYYYQSKAVQPVSYNQLRESLPNITPTFTYVKNYDEFRQRFVMYFDLT
jgi:hypothetical protein